MTIFWHQTYHKTPYMILLYWPSFFEIFGKPITFFNILGVYTSPSRIWLIFVKHRRRNTFFKLDLFSQLSHSAAAMCWQIASQFETSVSSHCGGLISLIRFSTVDQIVFLVKEFCPKCYTTYGIFRAWWFVFSNLNRWESFYYYFFQT